MHSGRAIVKGVLMGPVGAGSVTASGPAERDALLEIEGALLEDFDCQTLSLLGTCVFTAYLRCHVWICVEKLINGGVLCIRRNKTRQRKEKGAGDASTMTRDVFDTTMRQQS